MAEEEIGKVKVRGRLSFEHLFKKSASIDGGPEKYRCNIILDPSTKEGKASIGQVENAIDDLVDEVWKGKRPKFKTDRLCFMDGEDMVDAAGDVRNGYEGMMFVKAANDKKPKLRARNGQDEVLEEDDLLYSGANVIAYLRLYAITDSKKGGNGIFATVEGVQFVSHGDKFGGGGMNDDEFEQMEDEEDGRSSRRRRSRDEDEGDDRSSRRRSRDEDEDEGRSSRRRSRDEDEGDDRSSRRRSRDEDEGDDRSSRRRSRDEDEDDNRSSRRRTRDDDI